MSYRGLDPRTRVVRWGAFLVVVGGTIALFAGTATQVVAEWLTVEQDRLAWYAIRLLGLLSWAALTGSVIYGLLLSTGILDAIAHRTVSFALHQELSAIGLALALVHGALLTVDTSMPFSLAELLVPFAAPYRPVWVGLGQLGLYLAVIIVVSFTVRRRIGQPTWRRLHYLTFLIAVATTLHGLMAGTDSGTPFALAMYGAATGVMVALVVYRVHKATTARRERSTATGPATVTRQAPGQPPRLAVVGPGAPTADARSGAVESRTVPARAGASE